MQASYAPKVIPVEIEEDKKKKIIEKLVKEFDEALDSRSGLDKKRETWLKQYNSRLVDPSSDEEIQLDIPTTHEFLGQQCARILHPIFSQPTVFIASPRYPSEDKRGRAMIGPIIAAKLSGRPIVPMACAMRGGFRLRSWDSMRVPVLAQIVARAGNPISVPQDATREDCERLRLELQDEVIRTEAIAAGAL